MTRFILKITYGKNNFTYVEAETGEELGDIICQHMTPELEDAEMQVFENIKYKEDPL